MGLDGMGWSKEEDEREMALSRHAAKEEVDG